MVLERAQFTSLLTLAFSASILLLTPSPGWTDEQATESFLDMGLAQLMQVTLTSAAKKEQSLDETAAAAFVITAADIKRSTATTVPELLAMVPGIQVAQIANGKWSVSSRGFGGYSSNKLLVMIDGRSVYTPAYSGTYWDMQNVLLEDIDRIEVIRGPGGTLWGANAVNGVINIITKESQETVGTLVRGSLGSQEQTGAVRYGTPIGNTSFGRFFVFGKTIGSNELHDGSGDSNDDWDNMQAGFRLDGITDARTDWRLSGDIYKNSGDQIVAPYWTETPPFLSRYDDDYQAEGANLNASWSRRFDEEHLLTVNTYIDYTNREEIFLNQTFTTLNLDLQYEMVLGEHNDLTMGVGYRYIDSSFDETFQVQLPEKDRSLYSAFVQDEIELVDQQLWLTLGTKVEHNEYTGVEWQPSARLLYKPDNNHSLWTSVARAVRTPSQIEDSGRVTVAVIPNPSPVPTSVVQLVGRDDFDSEEVIAYEAGYRWQAKGNLSFDVAAYYNSYDKMYSSLPGSSPLELEFVNALDGDGYGVELAANWQPLEWLGLNLAYTWQKLDLDWRDSSYEIYGDSTLFEDSLPRNMFTLRSHMVLTKQWQSNLSLRYTDEVKAIEGADTTTPIDISDWWQLNANVIWNPTDDLEITLAGRNIFNDDELQAIAEFITPATDINADIYLMATWKF